PLHFQWRFVSFLAGLVALHKEAGGTKRHHFVIRGKRQWPASESRPYNFVINAKIVYSMCSEESGGAAGGAGSEELSAGTRVRTESASTRRSTSFFAPEPSGSLSGLYCVTVSPTRLLLRAASASAARTSASGMPPSPGTFTAEN